MAGFLPSAQFTRVVGALAVVVGGITLAYFFSSTPSDVTRSPLGGNTGSLVPVANPLLQQAADIDTDNDGLRDWEERLWKTNVLVADSDGDGTNDQDEIDSNRNPLVRGPNDLVRDTINLSESLSPATLASLSPTERVAREFFVEYLSYKKGGALLDESEKQKLLFTTIRNSAEEYRTVTDYTLSDVITTPSDDAQAVRLYGNMIGTIMMKHSYATENELVLLERAMRTQNESDLMAIQKISESYTNMVSDMAKVAAPARLQLEHVDLLNQLQVLSQESFALTLVREDPIQTMLAVSNYETNVRNLLTAIQNIQAEITAAQIQYGPEETGVVLMSISSNAI